MNRTHKSQLREITLQLTELQNRLNAIHWELGESIPVEKSIEIGRALSDLKSAIKNLVGVI